MKSIRATSSRSFRAIASLVLLVVAGGTGSILMAACGPFTDVGGLICPFVLELYYVGIAAGTSASTYSPNDPVTRGQMAIFLATTLDQSLQRGSRAAALNQWWTTTPQYASGLGTATVGGAPYLLQSDGADLWVADSVGGNAVRVRGSDGAVLQTWTQATGATGVLVALGRVFITGNTSPGSLYMLDPTHPVSAVSRMTTSPPLGNSASGIAFDGSHLWVATPGSNSISIITPGNSLPWTALNVSLGGSGNNPLGLIFDGSNTWVTDSGANALYKLDSGGAVLQTVAVGASPHFPIFDGENVWVPNQNDDSVTVVRAATGAVLAILTGNGLNAPQAAAFDGQRILVTNGGNTPGVSLWKAASLSPLGFSATASGTSPLGACSDGLDFWIALSGTGQIGRF